ncbi:MAG: S9 family peptidase, partial [Myxococcaceae bacterium]
MKRSLFILLVVLSACASQKDNAKPEGNAVADAGTSKLQEAAELGRIAADYPPRANQCPPPTRRSDTVFENFGQKTPDAYAWLEDEKSPEVQQWMLAQDKCARNVLAHLPNRDVLAKRFKQLYYVDSVSPPIKRGTRYFYVRTHADKEKPIVYWREGEKGQEKVLLDPNKWSAEGTISLGEWVPSWDGKKVAFTQRPNAADEATLYVLDVDTNKQSDVDVIEGAKYASPDWLPDNSGFYYEFLPTDPKIPVAERPGYTELRLHKLGVDPKTDAVIHEKTGDPSTFLEGSLSRDGKYLFVYVIRGWSENDVYLQRVGKQKDFTLLVKGKDAQYGVEAWKDNFYIVTDEGAPKQHVFKVSAAKPERKNWKEIVKEDKDATLDGVNIVGGQLSLSYLKDASSELRLASLDGKPERTVALPLAIGTSSNLIGNEDEDEAFYSFSSFTLPKQVYRTSIAKGGAELWAKVELPIDPTPYTVTLVRYPSKDGTQIPMFLIH